MMRLNQVVVTPSPDDFPTVAKTNYEANIIMPENSLDFLLSCLDNCNKLEKLQVLLEIAIEQFEDRSNHPNQVLDRLEVLIECYQAFAGNNINQLQSNLQALRNQQAS